MKNRFVVRACACAAGSALALAGLVGVAAPSSAASVNTYGIALRVALNGQAGAPLAVVANANATVAAAYAPPDSSVSAVDVAAALAGQTGVSATNGTASASATASAAQNRGTSRIDGLDAQVIGQPTGATVLAGTATCPTFGAPTADTTVTALSVFGQAITATVNGPTVTVNSATTVAGVTAAVITAAVRTRIETTTATTATATALQVSFTLTGTVDGAPISVPLGTITAGTAACERPALPAPTETGLTPKSGPTAGGTQVTVTGSGFVAGGTSVTIGGITVPAADVTVSSPTTLTFVTPPHALGPVQVTSTTDGGTTGPQTYTYLPPPTEAGLHPTSGPTAGGTTVTVTGTGFVPGGTSVTVGGTTVPAGEVTVTGPTTLTFVTPPHSAGPVQVTTTTAGGTSAGQTYTYVPPPAGTSLDPPSGTTAGGSTVTVTGSGFTPGGTTVTIGGITIPASAVTVTSPGTLSFTAPAHASGPVGVTVTTSGGTSAPLSYTYLDDAAVAGAGAGLASTGSSVGTPLTVGLAALLAGLFLLVAMQRRRWTAARHRSRG